MKYLVLYYQNIVGFANSLEEFLAFNQARQFPYLYEEENLTLVELRTDVFAITPTIHGTNFADYQRFGKKETD